MKQLTRREAILAAGMAGAGTLLGPGASPGTAGGPVGPAVRSGRLRQSVSRWCYGSIPLPDFCQTVADMGLAGVDLLGEEDWAVVADHGLVCTMGSGAGGSIAEGLNDLDGSGNPVQQKTHRDLDDRGEEQPAQKKHGYAAENRDEIVAVRGYRCQPRLFHGRPMGLTSCGKGGNF